jgi:hypothetical protein
MAKEKKSFKKFWSSAIADRQFNEEIQYFFMPRIADVLRV